MPRDAVDDLLTLPSGEELAPGASRALVAARDIVGKSAAIAEMRSLAQAGDMARALALAGRHLNAERRNETLARTALGLAADAGLGGRLIESFETTGAWPAPPVVEAALYLAACLQARKPPRLDGISPLVWTAAIRWLFDYGRPEALNEISAAVVQAYPNQAFAARLGEATALVPPPQTGDRFRDRLDACAQFARSPHPAPRGLLVCVCGYHGRMGVPLNFIHRWATRRPYHVLYLRDLAQRHYRSGVAAFGATMDDTVDTIDRLRRRLGVGELAFYGSSMGGLVAIRLGRELGAHRILSAAGTADVAPREDGRELDEDQRLAVTRVEAAALAETLRQGVPGRIAYLYGEAHQRDAIVADALRDVPGVDTVTFDGLNRHNIDFYLVMSGRYDHAFAWLAGERDDLSLAG